MGKVFSSATTNGECDKTQPFEGANGEALDVVKGIDRASIYLSFCSFFRSMISKVNSKSALINILDKQHMSVLINTGFTCIQVYATGYALST